MKIVINCWILLFVFTNCKKDAKPTVTEQVVIKQKIVAQEKSAIENKDSIKVFHIFYDSITSSRLEKVTTINKSLLSGFKGYKFDKDPNEFRDFKKMRELSKTKGFLQTLAKDFENKNFLEVPSVFFIPV